MHEWLSNQPDSFEQTATINAPQQNEITFLQQPAVTTLPTTSELSSTYNNTVNKNITYTTTTQPTFATNLSNNAATNISTFINNQPQNYSHEPIENVSNNIHNNMSGQPQVLQTPKILCNEPPYFQQHSTSSQPNMNPSSFQQHSTTSQPNINPPFFTTVNHAQPAPRIDSNYNQPLFYTHPSSVFGSNNLSLQQMNARLQACRKNGHCFVQHTTGPPQFEA